MKYNKVSQMQNLFLLFESSYQVNQCASFYNISAKEVAEAVAQTNEYYSGYDIQSSRIVFPNGSIDPWHALGITADITAELPAVFIKGEEMHLNQLPCWYNGTNIIPTWYNVGIMTDQSDSLS